jgi:hypothetical protein
MPDPRRDHRDRHALQMHLGRARVPDRAQLDMPQPRAVQPRYIRESVNEYV